MHEMPELVKLQDKYRSKGVRVVAVSMDAVEPIGDGPVLPKDVAAVAAKRGFSALDLLLYVGDHDALVNGPWDLPGGLPFTLVLGKDGQVVARHQGGADLEEFEALVDQAL